MSEDQATLTSARPAGDDGDPQSVTVVVPTKNAARTLAACLQSLRAQTYPCHIVVVDNESTDPTVNIAEQMADLVLHRGPERSAQRNYGARSSPADIVGFIDADMVLEPTVVEEAVDALRNGAGSVIVPERTVGSGFWAEVRAFERSFYVGSDAIEAARFFRWDIFERTGGFDEDLTGPEDTDLSESARSLAPVARTSAMILHDEGTIRYLDACRKKAYYAEGLRRYVVKRGGRALVQRARRPWLYQPQKLLNLRGAGLITLKAGEGVSIMLALTKISRLRGGTGIVDGHFSLVRQGRRSWEIFRATRHGTRNLARLAVGLLAPRLAGDANFHFRCGLQLVAPARQYHWWPIVEVILDDCYQLTEIAAELQGSPSHVVDIGAHVGSFTVALAKAVPAAEVTAFEPSGERVEYLLRNAIVNGVTDRVHIVQAAVAGKAGRRLLTKTGVLAGLVETQGETVDVVAFDEIMGRVNGRVGLLKMDCEGTEYEIVESASAAALRKIDRLILEYHPAPPGRLAGLLARLTEAGLVERWRRDTLPGQLGVIYFARVGRFKSSHDPRRPKVGFITESFLDEKGNLVEGGAERQLLHLVGVARDLGAGVTVYQRGPHTWQGNYNGIRVVAQPSRLSALGRTLGRRAVSDGCTHLHFQYLERVPWHLRGPRITATAHAVYWDIPYVSCYRQWYPGGMVGALVLPVWRAHQLLRVLLAVGRCERVLTTDTTLLRIVQACRPAVRQRLEVVPNFTDLHDDVCDQSAVRASINPAVRELLAGRAQGHVVVLVPRNLSFVRGGAWLCQIVRFATDTSEGKQCHFFVTGVAVDVYGYASRYRKLFQDQVDALPTEARRRIHLLGGVPRAAMRAAYQASDIVLIPTFAHEGTSLAALEAMGAGIPVVATNVGGLNDVVQHGVTGLLVPPDPLSLADAIASLAADAPLRKRLGEEGQRVVEAAFTEEHWRARAEHFARSAGWATEAAET